MPAADTSAPSGGGDPGRQVLRRVETELASRWPESRIEPTLQRISAVMDLLGSPQAAYPVVHITGTNGKTTTARMVDALLRAASLRTGRYTSPHVESVTERISVDGAPLPPERFAAAYDEVAPYVALVDDQQGSRLSFFEVLTAMAYAAFADSPVDGAVVEVGMGGTWDATNVADGRVAVVTPIAVDHAHYLGDDVATIAGEKAGIVKPGAMLVLAQQPVEAAEVLLRRAVEVGATVAREGLEFGLVSRDVAVGGQQLVLQGLAGTYEEVFLPLHGAHQAQNAACALAAVEAFFGAEREPLDADLVRGAFAGVSSPGRLEVVRRGPSVVLDAAHNPAAARALASAVTEDFAFTRLVGVVAALGDKDVAGVLEALEPVLNDIVVTTNGSHRALPVDDLAALAVEIFGRDRVEVVPRLDDALDTAVALAEQDGDTTGAGVLVTGSVVTVGEARMLLRGGR